MLKRVVSVILILACCLSLSACGPYRRVRQVKNLKALFPEVKQFVDDNRECMQTLLVIKDRIREFNESQAVHWGSYPIQALPAEFLPIDHYVINVNENQVEFLALWYTPSPEEELSLITEEERVLLSETILKISYEYRSFYITQDSINIIYTTSENTGLSIVNPTEEIADPGAYPSIVNFSEPVNDDWCIMVSNYTQTIFW